MICSTNKDDLKNLSLITVDGMIDPLRPEAKEAIQLAEQKEIKVAMIFEAYPVTALAIAKQLNLASNEAQVVTGSILRKASPEDKHHNINQAKVLQK